MDDDRREIEAELMTLNFMVEILLSLTMAKIPELHLQSFVDGIVDQYQSSNPHRNLSDEDAEILSDLKVRSVELLKYRLARVVEGVRHGHQLQKGRSEETQ